MAEPLITGPIVNVLVTGLIDAATSKEAGVKSRLSLVSDGFVDTSIAFLKNLEGKLVRAISDSISPAEATVLANLENALLSVLNLLGNPIRRREELAGRMGASVAAIASDPLTQLARLGESLATLIPQPLSVEGLLEKLGNLLLKPKRVPGEPCLAPAPLLRDLLDVALGRVSGGIGAVIAKVGETVEDLLLPAFGNAEDTAHTIRSILADPVTAALNLVLGKRNQIDCVVEGSLDVGESVFGAVVDNLGAKIAGAIA